jgi:hypothetical protein
VLRAHRGWIEGERSIADGWIEGERSVADGWIEGERSVAERCLRVADRWTPAGPGC